MGDTAGIKGFKSNRLELNKRTVKQKNVLWMGFFVAQSVTIPLSHTAFTDTGIYLKTTALWKAMGSLQVKIKGT